MAADNNLGPKSCVALKGAFAKSTSITSLNLHCEWRHWRMPVCVCACVCVSRLTYVPPALSGNEIGDDGCDALGQLLAENSSIQVLTLSGGWCMLWGSPGKETGV